MRSWIAFLVFGCLMRPAWAGEHRLYAAGASTKGYVVGAPLQKSGLFVLDEQGRWLDLGFTNPAVLAVDHDPRDPSVLYLAVGNGCIRAADSGRDWSILTDWRVTELQDVAVDPNRPDSLWIALPDGLGFSPDQGRSWERRTPLTSRKYFQNVVVDRTRAGRVLAGGETGLFLSNDEGKSWQYAGGEDDWITHLVQSRAEPRRWAATTQNGGLLLSADGGRSWRANESLDPQGTLYNADFDRHRPGRLAVAGWGVGVAISEDDGASWSNRTYGLPSKRVWRVAFDPDHPRRIYASVHEQAVYVSDDLGYSWTPAGLEGSVTRELEFIPEATR
ncbi:MAG: hypothetical protein GC160_12620 [Acidobacteria bacterium]|nr:hypothetical protein [Acidobacteriota bacterium]